MLSMIGGLLGAACLACGADAPVPTQPGRLQQTVHVNQQLSDGCTRFALRVVNGAPAVEALYNTTGCPADNLKLEADSTPVFDSASGRLRVPIVIRNTGSVTMIAPARIRFAADSAQFLNGQGQVIPGLPDIVAVNYDSANANGRVGQWRYDTLLATSGTPQVLAPGAVSRRRWLEFAGTSWSQIVRIKLPTVGTVVPTVPVIAPDSIPRWIADSTLVVVPPPGGGFAFIRDVISVEFVVGATVDERSAALASVQGQVVGGVRSGQPTGGLYIVRLPASSNPYSVAVAEGVLRSSPVVKHANRFVADRLSPTYRRPVDGPGWLKTDWPVDRRKALPPNPWRGNWGMVAIRAPLAWGCEVGDSTVRVGVVDIGFSLASTPDLSVNTARARGDAMPSDTAARHGDWVSSVLAARGDNSIGMTGVAWRTSLDAIDPTMRDSLGRPFYSNGVRRVPYDAMIAEMLRLVNDGARVVNVSLGANTTPIFSMADSARVGLARAFIGRYASGVRTSGRDPLTIVSSGNVPQGDPRESFFPLLKDSASSSTIVVTASRRDGTLYSAPTGSASIDVAAPADDVRVLSHTTLGNGSGASFAAPMVSGIAALLLSFDPRLTASQVRQLIIAGAVAGGDTAGGYPVVDAYESLKLAAQRPGAPLCGNPITYTATFDTIANTQAISAYAKRVPGPGGFEHLTTFTMAGNLGAPVYAPHGGKELLVDLGDALGLRRVARHNGTAWQSLSAPWAIANDSSITGVTWSSRGWTHDGDTALYSTKSYNPGFQTANISWSVWTGGVLGAPLASFANLPDTYATPGQGIATGAAGVGGTIAPAGDFAIGFVTDGSAVKSYRFYKLAIPVGGDSLLFSDTLDWLPQYGPYSVQAPFFGLTISEDGSEFWYTAPVQDHSHYFGCVLKRYSLRTRQFVSVDVLPSGGSGLGACTPTSMAWQSGAARVRRDGPRMP